jgi:hypothetical protein
MKNMHGINLFLNLQNWELKESRKIAYNKGKLFTTETENYKKI